MVVGIPFGQPRLQNVKLLGLENTWRQLVAMTKSLPGSIFSLAYSSSNPIGLAKNAGVKIEKLGDLGMSLTHRNG